MQAGDRDYVRNAGALKCGVYSWWKGAFVPGGKCHKKAGYICRENTEKGILQHFRGILGQVTERSGGGGFQKSEGALDIADQINSLGLVKVDGLSTQRIGGREAEPAGKTVSGAKGQGILIGIELDFSGRTAICAYDGGQAGSPACLPGKIRYLQDVFTVFVRDQTSGRSADQKLVAACPQKAQSQPSGGKGDLKSYFSVKKEGGEHTQQADSAQRQEKGFRQKIDTEEKPTRVGKGKPTQLTHRVEFGRAGHLCLRREIRLADT